MSPHSSRRKARGLELSAAANGSSSAREIISCVFLYVGTKRGSKAQELLPPERIQPPLIDVPPGVEIDFTSHSSASSGHGIGCGPSQMVRPLSPNSDNPSIMGTILITLDDSGF